MRRKSIIIGLFTIILMILVSGSIFAIASDKEEPAKAYSGEVYIYTGSPLVLANGEIKMLDPSNPDLGATVIQSKTLLPLKAVSEYFGADVAYDQVKKEAVIKYDGKEYAFPIGSRKYIVRDGLKTTEYAMDTQSMIVDGRTMVPLRVIGENVLGKKVSYFDRVIAVADHEVNLQSDAGLIADVRAKIGEAVKARTMTELEQVLTARGQDVIYKERSVDDSVDGAPGSAGTMEFAPAAEEGLSPAPSAQSESNTAVVNSKADSSFSATNTQVEGIDEADIVKTDGKYLYIAGNNAVRIVGADQGKLSDDAVIRLAVDKYVNEIYVDGSRLILLGTRSEYGGYAVNEDVSPAADEKRIGIMPPYIPPKTFSFADVYDISDPVKPVFLKGHEMEGSYLSSRKNGEIVYLVTNTYPSGGIVLPMMRDTAVSNKAFSVNLDDVMIMPRYPSPGYLVISAINVNNNEKTEVEAITAYGATMYMNDTSLYLAFNNAEGNTSIVKFELAGMKVGYAGSGKVPGSLLNQFSMDEYEGNLRVATTVWQTGSNSLYILNPSLNIVGSIENLAKGESIYSVRFVGDKGYVVTFRTIDPLFVFDLTDPEKPVLTGELKVPGFSSYLQPVGNDLLLGIGADTYDIYRKDESGRDVVVGTRQGGIKFSLFDISDMGKPKEISKYVVGDSGSGSEALYNHKAIMVDQTNGNIAIDAYLFYENQQKGSQQGAVIMSFSGNKLSLKGILDSEPSGVYGNFIPYARRILYIGDELYYVQDGKITSYDYGSLKQIDSLTLR